MGIRPRNVKDEERTKINDAKTLLKDERFHTNNQYNTPRCFRYLCIDGDSNVRLRYDAGTLNDTLIERLDNDIVVCFPKSEEAAVRACLAIAALDPPATTLALTPDAAVDSIEQFIKNCGFRTKLMEFCHMEGELAAMEIAGEWFEDAQGQRSRFRYGVVDDQNRDGVRTLSLRGTFDLLGDAVDDELEVKICGDIVSGAGRSSLGAYMVDGTFRAGRMELRKGAQLTIEANGPPAEGWQDTQIFLVQRAQAAGVSTTFLGYRQKTPPWAPRTASNSLPSWGSKPWLYLAAMMGAHELPEAIRRRDAWSDADRAADAAEAKRLAFYRYCDRAAQELIKHEVAVLQGLDDAKIRERVVPRINARDAYITAVRRGGGLAANAAGSIEKALAAKKRAETRRLREGSNLSYNGRRPNGGVRVDHNCEDAFASLRLDRGFFDPDDDDSDFGVLGNSPVSED
jgi:hypothetical protein